MEWLDFFKTLWAILTFIILTVALVAAWRVRGIFSWQKSLKAELAALKIAAGQDRGPIKSGAQIIEDTCTNVFQSLSPEIGELRDLPIYIKSIAACFHPDSDCPELQISVNAFLMSLEKSLTQFDRILKRPGFRRLKTVNLHKIGQLHQRYRRLSEFSLFRWILAHRKMIRRISRVRLFLFLDPVVWLVYFSNQLTTLVFFKYLMVDIYLFIGKLSLEAYSEAEISIPDEGEKELRETLEELYALGNDGGPKFDSQIQEIRNQLVGFPSILISNPTFAKWQAAVHDAALIIAKNHFPDSGYPIEEAALGPLLESVRTWAGKVSQGTQRLLTRRLFNLRLETIYKAKNLSESAIPKAMQGFIKKLYKTYGWLKGPLKVYRLVRKATPWKISLEVGWAVSKKAGLAYIHGRAFDTACEELEQVYRRSSTLYLKIPSTKIQISNKCQ